VGPAGGREPCTFADAALGAEVRAVGRLAARRVPPSPEADLLPAEFDRFWSQVRALPPRQAQAVALHYLEDRPVREVAELMGCSEGTAKALLHQARQRLARRLGDGEVDA
jgi:RNA polymerase sigma-70 factor, ECF subfamily